MNVTLAPILELHDVSKRLGAVQALSHIECQTYSGQVTVVVGENGAGKTTLIQCMSGVIPIDGGTIRFEGRPVTFSRPQDAAALGIETMHQDLGLCDNLDVVANLFLGRERKTRLVPGLVEPMDETAMAERAVQTLHDLSISLPSVRTPVGALSGGQRQSVAVARALMWQSKVMILDEPTASLGSSHAHLMLDLVRRLRDQGLAVLLASHSPEDVCSAADRIMVLKQGRNAGTFPASAWTLEQVHLAMGRPSD